MSAPREPRDELREAARAVLAAMPDRPKPDRNGEYGLCFISPNAPVWGALEQLRRALAHPEQEAE